jgi:hypothetical protein
MPPWTCSTRAQGSANHREAPHNLRCWIDKFFPEVRLWPSLPNDAFSSDSATEYSENPLKSSTKLPGVTLTGLTLGRYRWFGVCA